MNGCVLRGSESEAVHPSSLIPSQVDGFKSVNSHLALKASRHESLVTTCDRISLPRSVCKYAPSLKTNGYNCFLYTKKSNIFMYDICRGNKCGQLFKNVLHTAFQKVYIVSLNQHVSKLSGVFAFTHRQKA